MRWWPGQPHLPHRNADKVRAIQRSLDWKRVVQIAAYLLQKEIPNTRELLRKHFESIYQPKASDPGREWPPKISRVIGFERSVFPIFSNVLIHVNGAKIERKIKRDGKGETATLTFDEHSRDLNVSVIDGQHRINGAYLAVVFCATKVAVCNGIFLPKFLLTLMRPAALHVTKLKYSST